MMLKKAKLQEEHELIQKQKRKQKLKEHQK